jgi:flagellar biosynthesis GTPase FlhF
MHFLIALFVFFCIARCQDFGDDQMSNKPRICSKKEIERLMTGSATKVIDQLRPVFDESALVKFLNHTHSKTEINEALQKANFKSFVSIVGKPILVKGDRCWIDFLTFATFKDSDCILGGRKVVILQVKNDKISNWDEVFFPLNLSHLCTEQDYARLPQSHFGSLKDIKFSHGTIELPREGGMMSDDNKPIERTERSRPIERERPVRTTAGGENTTSEKSSQSQRSQQSARSSERNTSSDSPDQQQQQEGENKESEEKPMESAGGEENTTSEKSSQSQRSQQSASSSSRNTSSSSPDQQQENKEGKNKTENSDSF